MNFSLKNLHQYFTLSVQSARSVIDARIQSTEELDVLQADLEKVGTDLLNRHAELTDLHQELCSRKVPVAFIFILSFSFSQRDRFTG